MWMVAQQVRPSVWRVACFYLLVCINGIFGIRAIGAEFIPYSEAKNAAAWIVAHDLRNATWVGTPDYATSAVAGYLRRPMYYAECNCVGTFVRWNAQRHEIGAEELDVLLKRIAATQQGPIYIITNQPRDFLAADLFVSVIMLAEFTGARLPDGNLYLYRIQAQK